MPQIWHTTRMERKEAGICRSIERFLRSWRETGDMPTPEEWLSYVVRKLESEGRSELLRWYPNL